MKVRQYQKQVHKLPLFVVGLGLLVSAANTLINGTRFKDPGAKNHEKSIVSDRQKLPHFNIGDSTGSYQILDAQHTSSAL